MDLSVIIPCRDVAGTIAEQLDALLAEDWSGDWEIVLVDNRSADGTREILDRYAASDRRIRVVDAPLDDGVSYVRNVGIEASGGERLALCDGDDVVGRGWIAAMAGALQTYSYVTGPLELRRLNDERAIASRPGLDRDEPGTFLRAVPFAHSCNVGITRAVVEQYGGFDLDLADSADIGLGIRLSTAGINLHYSREAVVHYRLRPTPGAAWRQARRNGRLYPKLAQEVRRAGLHIPRRAADVKYWPWLIWRAGLLRTPAGRARWCFVVGTAVGRAEGSIRYRTLFL